MNQITRTGRIVTPQGNFYTIHPGGFSKVKSMEMPILDYLELTALLPPQRSEEDEDVVEEVDII